MTQAAFGPLLALAPAIGLSLGLVVRSQEPSPVQLVGTALVVIVGPAAQPSGQRPSASDATPTPALTPAPTPRTEPR